jgi:hypothetical protein
VVSRSGVAVGSCCWPIIVVGRRLKQAGRHGVVSRSGVAVGSCCWPIIAVGRRLKQAGRHGPLWASNWCIATVHKVLIALTKLAREGHKGKTAERIAAGEVRQLFGEHIHRRLVAVGRLWDLNPTGGLHDKQVHRRP